MICRMICVAHRLHLCQPSLPIAWPEHSLELPVRMQDRNLSDPCMIPAGGIIAQGDVHLHNVIYLACADGMWINAYICNCCSCGIQHHRSYILAVSVAPAKLLCLILVTYVLFQHSSCITVVTVQLTAN